MRTLRAWAAAGAVLLAFTLAPAAVRTASAIPTLQLDIEGGFYDPVTETTVTTDPVFDLSALLTLPTGTDPSGTYYVSIALQPKTIPPGGDFGTIVFGGTTIDVTADMQYGVPPLEANLAQDGQDLAQHGVYETYFYEYAFAFDPSQTVATPYNTADPSDTNPNVTQFVRTWTVDITGLASAYFVHFDLYNTVAQLGGDIDANDFAPFSHDAEVRRQVNEPASVLMLGVGLAGLAFWSHRKALGRS